MASPEFAAGMDGFDPEGIVGVDSMLLDPTLSTALPNAHRLSYGKRPRKRLSG
jgi:hypothetical protein